MYLNKATVVGNLARDPDLKVLPNGTHVCNMTVVTNSRYSKKGGEKVDKAEFHNVIIFGKLAEYSAQFLTKGQQVLVEGAMSTRSWEKPDGSKGYKMEIIASNVQFGSRQTPKTPQGEKKEAETRVVKDEVEIEYPSEEIDPASIPF